MRTIIEIAGYVLIGTVLFGVGIALYLIRIYWYQPAPVAPHPPRRNPPAEAVNEVKQALEKLHRQHSGSAEAQGEALTGEIRRLESRLAKLESKTLDEQRDFQFAAKLREVAWMRWKELHDRVAYAGRKLEPELRELLKEAEEKFRESDRNAEREWHTAVARDLVNLEELRGQQVLTPTPQEGHAGDNEAVPGGEPQAVPGGGAEEGDMSQADFAHPDTPKSGKRFRDPFFVLTGLDEGMLRGVDLSGSDFGQVEFRGLHHYTNCNFSRANLGGIQLERQERPHQFVGCNFSGAHFSGSRLNYVLFSQCDLSRTHWGGAALDHVKFVDCRMDDVFWEHTDLSLTLMPPDMAAQLDFSEASAPPRTPIAPAAPDSHGAPPGAMDRGRMEHGVLENGEAARPGPHAPQATGRDQPRGPKTGRGGLGSPDSTLSAPEE